jgi:hypothetical protein
MIYGAFIANKSSLINIKMLKIKLKLRISSISFSLYMHARQNLEQCFLKTTLLPTQFIRYLLCFYAPQNRKNLSKSIWKGWKISRNITPKLYINLNKDKKKFHLQDIIIYDCILSCLFHF